MGSKNDPKYERLSDECMRVRDVLSDAAGLDVFLVIERAIHRMFHKTAEDNGRCCEVADQILQALVPLADELALLQTALAAVADETPPPICQKHGVMLVKDPPAPFCPACEAEAEGANRLSRLLSRLQAVVDAQAEDEGLWFIAKTAPEAYLMAELRRLHEVIEGAGEGLQVGPPIPMLLWCPRCAVQHVDAPQPEKDWTNPPHRSHECQSCGYIWRPSDHPTTGVATIETHGGRDCPATSIDGFPTLLCAVVTAAQQLRDSGYDGPFQGEAVVPLFRALAALEAAE